MRRTRLVPLGASLAALVLFTACLEEHRRDKAPGGLGEAAGAGSGSSGAGSAGVGGGNVVPETGGSSSITIPGGAAGLAGATTQAELLRSRPVKQSEDALPIAGGTLLVTRADLAIAADPERAAVFLADLETRAVRSVALEHGDEPGRLAEGAPGVAYVVLRGAGALGVLDTTAARLSARVPICAAPRGVAYDARTNVVHVACRSGRLVTLDAASLGVTRTLDLAQDDLRDVLVLESGLMVTRFLSAELLVLDDDGVVKHQATPAAIPGCTTGTVAYHAVIDEQGHVAIAHQASSDGKIGGSNGAYGGSSCGFGESLVVGALARAEPLGTAPSPDADAGVDAGLVDPANGVAPAFPLVSTPFDGHPPPYDAAISRDGVKLVFSTGDAAASYDATANLWTAIPLAVRPVAVAFDSRGNPLFQSREPAVLTLANGDSIELATSSVEDTGLDLFYVNAGLGIACASCHPEGDEDGHTWHFASGLRRTQPLRGGVLGRAPFHWNGELADMEQLVGEVMVHRMGLGWRPDAERIAALSGFLDRLPYRPAVDRVDTARAERGAALFANPGVGCVSCHNGEELSNNVAYDVGTGGKFVTPTLLGVGFRRPLMHDGCAQTLEERFVGACGGGELHGHTAGLSADELGDLVAYLRTL